MRILVLCTGNSCRSQMAEGILKKLKPEWEVFSAGTIPASTVSRRAIRSMQEIGIDISQNTPKSIDQFLSQSFDYVLTVCDHANETCPVFIGKVKNRIHIGFPDPTKTEGEPDEVFQQFRRVRDDIETSLKQFFDKL
jgi:arsenate reductase (thioredoxin)